MNKPSFAGVAAVVAAFLLCSMFARAGEPAIPTHDLLVEGLKSAGIVDTPEEIPATVVDTGVLAFVPYTSYRLGADREINVYGDPKKPICVEIGLYRTLKKSDEEKKRAIGVIQELMPDLMLKNISLTEGKMVWMGVIAEVTPPIAEDAYGAWWISVYSLARLREEANSREKVQEVIVAKNAASPVLLQAGWTQEELKKSRPVYVTTTRTETTSDDSAYSGSSGGSVYVRGYFRKNGTYVRGHTRRR